MRSSVALFLASATLVVAGPTVAATVKAAAPLMRGKGKATPPAQGGAAAGTAPYCAGEYADEMSALSAAARKFDQDQLPYTYCIRTSAVYECPSYGADGSLRRTVRKVVAHGTGFGFRQQAGETLLVTNDHVADWPAVADEDHPVDDVPAGCKRVSDSLRIVENERDAYERDDVPLTRVVADPKLDVAILKAKGTLAVSPWKVGRSAALRERNAVDVRGFPLGVLRANNVGKVISAYERDSERDWDHDDFVIDALLSPGNSGSPVFAISCQTGEFELVGIYHAGYTKGSALNVVVGIDQLRDMLTTLKKTPRAPRDAIASLDAQGRGKLVAAARDELEPFFPFGGVTAAVRSRSDGALLFEIMSKDFPLQAHPALVLEDVSASDGSFGQLGRVWAGNRQGLLELDHSTLDGDARAQALKLLDALRKDALQVTSYRAAARQGMGSRERFQNLTRMERSLRRVSSSRADLALGALELAERLCPATSDAGSALGAALAVPERPERLLVDGAGRSISSLDTGWRPVITPETPSQGFVPGPLGLPGS